jgi:hypothetical protein
MRKLRKARVGFNFIGMDAVQKRTIGHFAIGVLIAQGFAIIFRIPSFAGNHASVASDTGV